ncbi:MAG: ATP-binding protein [Promethearchaeia archaeon]
MKFRKIKGYMKNLLNKNPKIGALFATFMSYIEIPMLECLNFVHKRISPYFKIRITRSLLNGRWGGRVIPLGINISPETKYLPSQEIFEIVSRSDVVAIGDCYCRTKHRNETGCTKPIKTCILLGFKAGKSLKQINYRDIKFKKVSKQKIIETLKLADEAGLVHQLIYFPTPEYYYVICNCCTCCCEALAHYKQFLSPKIIKSDFIQETNKDLCLNCGICTEICPFDARRIIKGNLIVDENKCFGCGVCVNKCPENAIKLIKK